MWCIECFVASNTRISKSVAEVNRMQYETGERQTCRQKHRESRKSREPREREKEWQRNGRECAELYLVADVRMLKHISIDGTEGWDIPGASLNTNVRFCFRIVPASRIPYVDAG